ncbi:MAG TPA: glycosyltransferase family 39 protein [Gemmatimonadaceae bacterium]|nr:glycosyltransferase family 39 protein [Gemmatimonadaceae bacterium]
MTTRRPSIFEGAGGRWVIDPTQARGVALVLALAHALAAWLMRTPGLGWGEDDAGYLLLAQELRHFSYREIQDVLAPMHARFPPVFPLLLSLVGAPFGDRLDVLLAFVALCSAAGILFFFEAARRFVGDELALLVSALYALNPDTLWDAQNLMAEAPFKLFAMMALWALSRERDGVRFAVIAAGATILAALTRTAGVVFVAALFAYWVLSRRYRWAFVYAAAATVFVGGWIGFAFTAPNPDDHRLYVADLGLRGRDAPEGVLHAMVTRLVPRMRRFTVIFPWVLSLPTVAGTIIDNVLWLAALLVFGITGFAVLVRRWMAAALWLASYVILLIAWRYALERFVSPIVPLLYLVLLAGCAWWGVRRFPSQGRLVTYALALLLAVGTYPRDAKRARLMAACDRAHPEASPTCWPADHREYLQLAHWVRDSVPPDAIMLVSKERAFYVHSGHKSINQNRALEEDARSLAPYLRSRDVRYTAVSPIGVRAREHAGLIAESCRDFALVRRFSQQTLLLRLRAADEAPVDDGTCAALRAAVPPPDDR